MYLTPGRIQRINQVLDYRTEYFAVVLEDVFQTQNASAVMRTCDCFGIQNMHVIEDRNQYHINRYVVRGSENWVDLHRYPKRGVENRISCVDSLKSNGYKIVVTSPHAEKSVEALDVTQKMAFCFGTEKTGISKELMQLADEQVKIPMYGFTESFNISVSAAIILGQLVPKLQRSKVNWKLSPQKRLDLQREWYLKSLKNGAIYESEFYKAQESKLNA